MYIWILSYIKRIVQHFQMYASQFLTESDRVCQVGFNILTQDERVFM